MTDAEVMHDRTLGEPSGGSQSSSVFEEDEDQLHKSKTMTKRQMELLKKDKIIKDDTYSQSSDRDNHKNAKKKKKK